MFSLQISLIVQGQYQSALRIGSVGPDFSEDNSVMLIACPCWKISKLTKMIRKQTFNSDSTKYLFIKGLSH